jgi:hypothetical protein
LLLLTLLLFRRSLGSLFFTVRSKTNGWEELGFEGLGSLALHLL